MGSRNNLSSTSKRRIVAPTTSSKPHRFVAVAIPKHICSKWFSDLQNILQQLTQLSGTSPAFSAASISGSRSRVMRIDTLESRELFAVLSGLVFEDVNDDQRFDPSVDLPAAHQWVFLDQNGNSLLDLNEPTLVSDASGIAEFHLDFGTWGTILPVPRLQDTLSPTTSLLRPDSVPGYIPLSVAAFDTVFRGDDGFDASARLSGGLTDWLIIPPFGEGEGDLVGNGVTVNTKPLQENDSTSTEVGEILLYGQSPPEGWIWLVSDERFEVVGNKIYSKTDTPVDYEQEPEIVMVVEGYDNGSPSPASSSSQKATVTLTVLDQNDIPTGIYLNGESVIERVAGASVGPVQVVDQDAGEPFAYSVSDQRFEIVGGMLKLRSDVALLHESEPFVDLVISARSLLDPTHYVEAAAHIEVLANPMPWTNGISPLDVNDDGVISATDALIIINILNASGGSLILPTVATPRGTRSTPDYVDVNGDGNVGALDALIVINRIRRDNSMGTAGGGNNGGATGSDK
jgi:hypothetical protein